MSPFASLSLSADKPARFFVKHPVTGLPLVNKETNEEAWIDVMSWHSAAAMEHRFKREDVMRRTMTPMDAEADYKDLGKMLARLTTGWNLVALDGTPINVECTFEMAAEMYNNFGLRWLRLQVNEFLNNEGNFLENVSKG